MSPTTYKCRAAPGGGTFPAFHRHRKSPKVSGRDTGSGEERLSSGNECWVFTKLVDLTIGWGRDSAWLQKADLVGVCSKSTVFRCLNAIEAAGLIVRKTRGCGIVYSVNIAEIDRAVAQDRKDAAMASLPKPKGNRGSTRVNLTSLRPSTRVNLTPPYKQYPSDTSYLQEESSIVPGTPVTRLRTHKRDSHFC